jgi:uncharacterized protein involved in type VI secretion and phage assembly
MAKLADSSGHAPSGVISYAVPALVVDNVDPDGYARIQVKFPTLANAPISFWLRQVSPNASKEFGLYALPEKDDEVLVVFMNGSQDVGVIIGQFWNGVDLPPKEAKGGLDSVTRTMWKGGWSKDGYAAGSTDTKKNDRRFWRSRSGHLIGFDDSSGKETVQIWDKSGQLALLFDSKDGRIILSNNKGDIHIRTAKDLYLEAGQHMKVKVAQKLDVEVGMDSKWKIGKNHEFKAGMNIKTEAGINAEHKAGVSYKAKGGVGIHLEGGVQAKLKGGAATFVEAGACTQVKGGMVMIN